MSETTNEDRAERAAKAVEAYRLVQACDDDGLLTDLLTDLMHYADREGLDIDAAAESARMHYEVELQNSAFENFFGGFISGDIQKLVIDVVSNTDRLKGDL